jgi:hypothetical protein
MIYLPYSFTNSKFYTYLALINPLLYPLTGNMLGDGHLKLAHGVKGGFPTGSATFAMTLKNFEYISYLYFFIYQEVLLLRQNLETNFSLLNTINIKTRLNGNVCWRLRISSKPANLTRL